ncbi:GNAT family N-acetyltransferase [Curtobacterium sp. TXMA1]|uniref:GNAT family N-acetyltransferase n=1 Tax=Curtobacterium sp. TXMA1 TaxID=2876939 RepID=UPI001CCD8C89|nr:GNAT family N-acetyltransferase [Curtobacterium sp. TXMA1]UBQ02690.1 GNAT family N-acetyltransferase [Curtobacterium sp. TXMA1]
MGNVVVVQAGDPRRERLEREGWSVSARSFGAQLDAERLDVGLLTAFVSAIDPALVFRSLGAHDVDAVLALDRLTADDYPGSVATRHEQMDRDAATPTAVRRASGAFAADGSLVAMTYVDVDGADAETDFTVVRPMHRGRGIGTALEAWSVLALQREGVRRFRTGGSADNVAIRRANAALGYVQDEEWVTLTAPDSTDAGT